MPPYKGASPEVLSPKRGRRVKETGTFYFPWVNMVYSIVRVCNEGSLRLRVARAQGIAWPVFYILLSAHIN
jgi:hypothetical protein